MHQYLMETDISLNLIGIKYNKTSQKDTIIENMDYLDELKKEKNILKKFESLKFQFL